jgi:hypothetical protein
VPNTHQSSVYTTSLFSVFIYKARTPMAMTRAPLTKLPAAAPVLWGREDEAALVMLMLAVALEAPLLAALAAELAALAAALAPEEATAATLDTALEKPAEAQRPAAAEASSVKPIVSKMSCRDNYHGKRRTGQVIG